MGDGPAQTETKSGGLSSRLLKAFGGGSAQPKETSPKPLVQDYDPEKVEVGSIAVSVATTSTGNLEVAFFKTDKNKKVEIVGEPRLLDGATADDKEEVLDTLTPSALAISLTTMSASSS